MVTLKLVNSLYSIDSISVIGDIIDNVSRREVYAKVYLGYVNSDGVFVPKEPVIYSQGQIIEGLGTVVLKDNDYQLFKEYSQTMMPEEAVIRILRERGVVNVQ